jgi:uncharacterized protein
MIMSTIARDAVSTPRRRGRRILIRVAGGLAALLLVVYLGIGALAANILTTPARYLAPGKTPATYGMTYQDVRFPARGGDLEIAGWYIPQAGSNRAIVIVHGKDGSRNTNFDGRVFEIVTALYQHGFAVLMIDLRGHGQSGDAHFSFGLNERRDIEGAVDWLKTQGFAAGSVGLLGISLGAAASIGAAADDPDIGALVADSAYPAIYPVIQRAWSGVSHLPDAFLPGMRLMHRLIFGYDIASSRPVDEIGKIASPVLLIHGTADTFIPIDEARQLKASAPTAELWEVPGATHGAAFGQNPQAYLAKVTDFFQRHLAPR